MALKSGRYGVNIDEVDEFGNLVRVDEVTTKLSQNIENGFLQKNLWHSSLVTKVERYSNVITLDGNNIKYNYGGSTASINNLYIPISENGDYSISFNSDINTNVSLDFTDEISSSFVDIQTNIRSGNSNGKKYARITIKDVGKTISITNFQLEFNSHATAYQPYAKPNVKITEELTWGEKKTFTPTKYVSWSAYGGCYYRKKGTTVQLNVSLDNTGGASSEIVGTLESGYRPTHSVGNTAISITGSSLGVGGLYVDSQGVIRITSPYAYFIGNIEFETV